MMHSLHLCQTQSLPMMFILSKYSVFSPCANRLHNFVVILHRKLKERSKIMWYEDYEDEYAGTYAHDVAGFSDEDIDSIFDGEPDAYWNIN